MPKNLDEAILYFQQKWTNTQLNKFKNKSEDIAVSELHLGTGMWIRNNWVHGRRDTALTNYFHSLGIYHPDNISSIILRSLHRTLNQKDIQLDKQVERIKAYWKPVIECKERQKVQSISNYNKFKERDNITIYMPVDTFNGSRNAVLYACPTEHWNFDEGKDLILKGFITKKYFLGESANVFFTVYVTKINRNDVPILMQQVKTGDKVDFSLTGLTIE